ncbi:MAG: AAA family ATPase [Candidatus Parabeggiatoa sp.]|nr:AAA family ATPase [Candidatus Parabeggiatoa sp.]
MKLSHLSFENYKTFQKRESIEVKPLTILIGRNSSGKSVISRLPLLIAHALSERANSPIELELEGLDFGVSFVDLIYNRLPHRALGIGASFIDDKGQTMDFWVKVQHFDEYRLQLISRFELTQMGKPILTLSWIGQEPLDERTLYRCDETGQKCQVDFRGFWPEKIQVIDNKKETLSLAAIKDYRANLAEGMALMNYLGPFRKEPQRTYRFPGGILHNVGLSGSKTAELLGDDFLRRKGKVLEAVGKWFSEYLGGWELSLSKQGDVFSLVMKKPDNPALEINLADVGTGIAQILPIVVQRQFESLTGKNSDLEIVEQPELHLHPSANGHLADLYIEAAKHSDSRFIIETHSENFLLRIRRRIAEKSFDSNQVIIYWINDDPNLGERIQTIQIQENGDVDKWPQGVFSEDFEEVKAIRKAQKGF